MQKNGELGVTVRYKNGIPYLFVDRRDISASAQDISATIASLKN